LNEAPRGLRSPFRRCFLFTLKILDISLERLNPDYISWIPFLKQPYFNAFAD